MSDGQIMSQLGSQLLKKIQPVIDEYGIILESDPHLPSVVGTIIEPERIHSSWWSHPKGGIIYETLNLLGSRPDILRTKLFSGKTTFIQQRLWPELLTIARSRSLWQLDSLTAEEKSLLKAVESREELLTDQYSKLSGVRTILLGKMARELEYRLLVYGEGFHTSSGAHAKRLKTWDKWMRDVKYDWKNKDIRYEDARDSFEKIVVRLENRYRARPRLPWVQRSLGHRVHA